MIVIGPRSDNQPPDRGACPVGDRQIAALAVRQLGVVTRAQLLAIGVGAGAIKHRRRSGRLHQLHRGVYLVGHEVPPAGALELAAVLTVGGDALLSHASAASAWGLLRPDSSAGGFHVTAVGRNPDKRLGITIHRTATLHAGDRRRLGPTPLTSPARTLVDLAGAIDRRSLEQLIAQAERTRLARRDEIQRALDRAGPRAGAATLAALLADTPAFTRSAAEQRLLSLIRSAGLPAPEVNARLANLEVDFLWRRERLVVEVDGYRYHADRTAFETDRRRDAELSASGYRVIRVTWRQLNADRDPTLARLAMALATR